jgi:DNA primase
MGSFSKESLELLRSKTNLVEVLSPYLKLARAGSAYKALCPFHEERTPSFVIQSGDSHYHCFGCGAHGDAIQFLMTHLRMSFVEAVEILAERSGVQLEETTQPEKSKGPPKALLKEALEKSAEFYHFYLCHTLEGHAALDYLYNRGIDLDFIRKFEFGLAPKASGLYLKAMRESSFTDPLLEEAGLLSKGREFFADRITIPIRDAVGSVIGFSARKYKADTFGGKYINTPETVLFKKSRVLFGLSYSRKTIAKERKALIVEGQIDALRLIDAGFAWTVAGQGTAFGEEHAKELIHLGVRGVYLALDGDTAGQEAAVKIGHLFSKEGVEVFVISLPEKGDPDSVLMEKGPQEWEKLIGSSEEYLSFLVRHYAKTISLQTPAGKNEIVKEIGKRIRDWDHPLMVHESLRKLAKLTHTPESLVGAPEENAPQVFVKRSASVTFTEIDPDRILEADLLRWLLLMGSSCSALFEIASLNLKEEHFRVAAARGLFEKVMCGEKDKSRDLLALAIDLDSPDQQLFMAEVLQKKVNRERALPCFIETVQRLLERHWMHEREQIKMQIYSGECSETEVLELARKFDVLKRQRPQVVTEAAGG